MNAEIRLPALGETVEEGTILRWYRSVGERVEVDEPLYEVETDKVVTDVPSPAAGYLVRRVAGEGETVPVGGVLGVLSDAPPTDDESSPAPAPTAPGVAEAGAEPTGPPTPTAPPPPVAGAAPGRRLAPRTDGLVLSPLVRRLLRDHDVDPRQLRGRGLGGRITRDDVLGHVAARGEAPPPDAPVPPAPAPSPPPAPAPVPASVAAPPVLDPADERVPFSSIRRITAEHMIRSRATSAHTLTIVVVDYERIARLRQQVGAAWREREGFSLTYLPFIIRATVDALRRFPRVNASVGDQELVVHRQVNVGVAVDLDMEGLVVPVIERADSLRLRGIARAVRELSDRARARRSRPDDLRGGTFTVTNPGGYGTFAGAAIINQPQVAILNTDGIGKEPVVVEQPGQPDALGIRHVGRLSLSWDHRAIDGAYAAAFLDAIRTDLQSRDWSQEL